MQVKAIKTHRIEPKESLQDILDRYAISLKEKDILVITSKILSLAQGRIVDKKSIAKLDLIRQEADLLLETGQNPYGLYLTIKNNILIPSAGIDESNADNIYVLHPKDIQATAARIWDELRKKHSIEQLGVLITDSHTTIMRRGVTGITLGWCGFEPLHSYINKPDLYGHPLRVTQTNILDALAASAVFVMGEGSEQTPLAIIEDAPKLRFLDRQPTHEEEKSIFITIEEDLYAPILLAAKWTSS